MIIETIETVLNNFLTDKAAYNGLRERPRLLRNYDSFIALQNDLPTLIEDRASIDLQRYLVVGSVGRGQYADVPWLCVFDKGITTSAQYGYYIAYLFKADMSGLYLTLNQGWTEYEAKYRTSVVEARKALQKNSTEAKAVLRSIYDFENSQINLVSGARLAKGYELGSICYKYYAKNSLPNENSFINDLRNMIGVYSELKGITGKSIFFLNDRLSEDEFQEEIQKGKGKQPTPGPVLRKAKRVQNEREIYNRDPRISAQALINANYLCEHNPTHHTFISRISGKNFVEAHHLIPMQFQDQFEYSLDVPENIASLCPNCHRLIHNAEFQERNLILEKIYTMRINGLKQREIGISIEMLKELYNNNYV